MSNTWRAFMSPLHDEKLALTNNNKQDVSSFVLSSRQTPQKKKDPSFIGSGQYNEGPPTSKTNDQHSQNVLKFNDNNPSEIREQINDIQNKVVTLKKKIMSTSPEQYQQNVIHKNQNSQIIQSFQQQLSQGQQHLSFQQNLNSQKFNQQLQGPATERSSGGYVLTDTERRKFKKISILPNEFTQYSTARSISNKAGSSQVKKNSFLEDFDNAHLIVNNNNNIVNPFQISEGGDQSNIMSKLLPHKQTVDSNIPQKEEQNETEMLKRCMLKIQQKLEKEKQKRRELKMLVKQSNMSIGTLRQDISNYQLDIQLVKQLTLNTTRAIETRVSQSNLRPSTTTAAQLTTAKKNTSNSMCKQLSKSKEKLINMVNVSNIQQTKQKPLNGMKVFARRKSKSVSSTINDFNKQGILHIDLSSLDSSDSSQEDIQLNIKNKQQLITVNKNLSYQPTYLRSEGETTTHQQQIQIKKQSKSRLSQETNTFSNELKQIQQQKKEKAQYYLSKLDKGKKPSLIDTSSSVSSSNMSALKFLQSNYLNQKSVKQQKTSKSTSKIINTSSNGKSNSKSNLNNQDNVMNQIIDSRAQNLQTCINTSGSSAISNVNSHQKQPAYRSESKDIIQKKLNEFKKFKEALNSEITELKKEFDSNDPFLASLNFEKLKEKALKDKKILLGLDAQNINNTGRFNCQYQNQIVQEGPELDNYNGERDQNTDQDFQTPVTHERGAQSDITTHQKQNINQSHCNNNQRTASKTTISESRETASFEKQKQQIHSKNFSKELLSPSEDILTVQQNNSQIQHQSGQFLSNMLMTESYTGDEYINSDRKNTKRNSTQEKQKQEYKMFQNQLNYFKMQETLNKHLRQYESEILEKQAAQENQKQLNQQQPLQLDQNYATTGHLGSISSSAPSVKNNSDIQNENSKKQSQNFQNLVMQQNKQQMQTLIKQQQQLLAQQNNISQESSAKNSSQLTQQQQQNIKQQLLNSSDKKKGIDLCKKQLFPEGAEFSDEDFTQQSNNQNIQQIYQQKQSICSNPVNINDYSTNESQQQQQQNILNSREKQKQIPQQQSQQVVTQPRYIENQNEVILKQIKKQQSESLLANQQSPIQQLPYAQHSNQKTGQSSVHSNQTNQINNSQGQQQNTLFYKTPQNNNNYNTNSNSNLTSAYSSTGSVNVKNLSPQQQLQQEQFILFLQQSNSHLHQSGSGGFTDRQYNKSSNSSEKAYPNGDTFTSPLMNLKSPDLNKSQLKKSGKNSVPSLPKSPNSVINYYQDPINYSNITGIQSNHSESLNYTASIGTTPAKSNFYSTPLQNQSINNTNNNFFLTNTSSMQNTNNNMTITNTNTPQQQLSNTMQQLSNSNNQLVFTKNQQQSSQFQMQNQYQEQPQEYITPQKK